MGKWCKNSKLEQKWKIYVFKEKVTKKKANKAFILTKQK